MGRPKTTSSKTNCVIVCEAMKAPFASLRAIHTQIAQPVLSTRTVRCCIRDAGLQVYHPAKKSSFSQKNIADQLRFCIKTKVGLLSSGHVFYLHMSPQFVNMAHLFSMCIGPLTNVLKLRLSYWPLKICYRQWFRGTTAKESRCRLWYKRQRKSLSWFS